MKHALQSYATEFGRTFKTYKDAVISTTSDKLGLIGPRQSGDIIYDGENLYLYCLSTDIKNTIHRIQELKKHSVILNTLRNNKSFINVILLDFNSVLLKDVIAFKKELSKSFKEYDISFTNFDITFNK